MLDYTHTNGLTLENIYRESSRFVLTRPKPNFHGYYRESSRFVSTRPKPNFHGYYRESSRFISTRPQPNFHGCHVKVHTYIDRSENEPSRWLDFFQ